MNDWLDWAKLLVPYLLSASGVVGTIYSCVTIKLQQRKLAADTEKAAAEARLAAAAAVKAAAEARSADLLADKAKIELIPKLLELVEEQAGKIMTLQDDHRRGLMREAESKVQMAERDKKIDDLAARLEACENRGRAVQAAVEAAAQKLQVMPKESP